MKRILFTLLLMAQVLGLRAQTVKGRVVDGVTGQPVPYATISLMGADSSLIAGVITDENGAYVLELSSPTPTLPKREGGKYILSVSFVGYETQYYIIREGDQTHDFILHETTAQLKEVEVSAKRPLVEREGDKIVMNVSASTFAIGNNGEDLLRKAPGVMIDKDGNILVNGKSVEIYIDGRPSYMSGDQLRAMLTGTDGSLIDKLEIITNPSAKYDAAGQGGIINIKLKKNKSAGLNGILSANYSGMYFKEPNMYHQQDMVNLNLNYRGKKSYTSLGVTQAYADNSQNSMTQNSQVMGPDTLSMRSESFYKSMHQYYLFRLANDWYIDSVNTLGFIVNVPFFTYRSGTRDSADSYSKMWLNGEPIQASYTDGYDKGYSPQHTVNLNFTHVFCDSLQREITANIDYNRYNTNGNNHTRNFGVNIVPGIDVNTHQIVDIADAKLDFQTMFWKSGMIETGVKYVYSGTQNLMATDSVLAIGTHSDTSRFYYSEHVAAAYITVSKQWAKKVTAKIGLRGEYTYSVGDWKTMDSTSRYSYFNLFPTAFVSYAPAEKWLMSLSYTRRIKRPSYYQLNPFVSYMDAHSYATGNPTLTPEFNHQVDVNFGWSQYVSLGFNFAHTQNMLQQQGFLQPNGDIMYAWTNFGTCTTHGGTLSLTELPLVPKFDDEHKVKGAWLALTVNGSYYNFINQSYSDPNYKYATHWGQVYGSLTTYLPKDIQMSVDGGWSAPMAMAYMKGGAGYNMNFGFKKMWPEKQVTLSLQVYDLLRSSRFDVEMLGLADGNSGSARFVSNAQHVTIGVVWMFGQQQMHKYRKVGVSDEASRLGSSGGVGK